VVRALVSVALSVRVIPCGLVYRFSARALCRHAFDATGGQAEILSRLALNAALEESNEDTAAAADEDDTAAAANAVDAIAVTPDD
jgi:cytidylate kinase